MKKRDIKREAARKALHVLLDSINCWPMEYRDFESLVKKIDEEFR